MTPAVPPLLPSERTCRFSRRWLLVSGVMLVALAIANVALFWEEIGFDALLGAVLGMAVICVLYQWFWRVMRIISWFLIALTLPFWGLAAFLLYTDAKCP